ncbi:unnamed protein product, partial [Owenia fusiformis]
GLCGNFNGEKDDDKRLRDGSFPSSGVTNPGTKLANSYETKNKECAKCNLPDMPECPDNFIAFAITSCAVLADKTNGPFAACLARMSQADIDANIAICQIDLCFA